MDGIKLTGDALSQYWPTLLDRRMPLENEVGRLIIVMKAYYLSYVLYYGQALPESKDAYVRGLIEFHGGKRPYGNKDIAASIAFHLGWDYKRQLCYYALPDNIACEADKLHAAVLEELNANGFYHT